MENSPLPVIGAQTGHTAFWQHEIFTPVSQHSIQ
jgi:hypothetical protein